VRARVLVGPNTWKYRSTTVSNALSSGLTGAEEWGPVEVGCGTDVALRHYLAVIRRGFWIIALTSILATAVSVFLSMRQETTYRASAVVFLGTANPAFLYSGIPEPGVDPDRYLRNQATFAQLPAVAERAVQESGITGHTAGQLLASSSVSATQGSDLLEFSVTDDDPVTAARLATSYARAYTTYKRLLDTRTIVRTRERYEQQIAELEANGDRGSARYDELVTQYERLRTLELLQGSNELTIRPADSAAELGPQPVRNGVLGAVLGLVLGIGLAFLRDALNTRIRSAAEVEEQLALPLLGRIPKPRRGLRRKDRLVMLHAPTTEEAEAYRILAANLEVANADRGARTIVVTSPLGGEGKSTAIANLAIALARAGRRVVLVDLDLRRPYLERFFLPPDSSPQGAPGVTDVLAGQAKLADALIRVPLDADGPNWSEPSLNGRPSGRVELLTSGATSNPTEVIASHALEPLLAELEQRADLILIAAAPLLRVSDTIALSSKVDALIVLVDRTMTRPVLTELRRVLEAARVVKLGVVLTGVTADDGYASPYGYRLVYDHRQGKEVPAARQRHTVA
jgi:Mrp family chromosome partitioning ATPase